MTYPNPESFTPSNTVVPELDVAVGFEDSHQISPVYPEWIAGPQGQLGLRFEDIQALSPSPNSQGAAMLWFSIELPKSITGLKLVEAPPALVSYADDRLELDLDKKNLKIDSQSIVITKQTYELLELFMTNSGIPFSKSQIIENIVDLDKIDSFKTTSVHKMIALARKALGEFSPFIKTTDRSRNPYCSYYFTPDIGELSTD